MMELGRARWRMLLRERARFVDLKPRRGFILGAGAPVLTTAVARRNADTAHVDRAQRAHAEHVAIKLATYRAVEVAAKKKACRLSGTPDYCLDRA